MKVMGIGRDCHDERGVHPELRFRDTYRDNTAWITTYLASTSSLLDRNRDARSQLPVACLVANRDVTAWMGTYMAGTSPDSTRTVSCAPAGETGRIAGTIFLARNGNG